ncbi:flagellin [Sporosarcina ureae]|uniref:flagellin n=1 Tax=Sporosarcina ureae TaxID=1571 RepID=UPI0026EF94DA|nr:flagellin [Sporosarcina ureae]
MSAVCIRTAEHAEKGLEIIDRSMNFILGELGNVGAVENSLEHIAANLRVGEESMMAALSRIEDVDVAKELMNSTKLQMLTQVGQTLAGHDKQRHEAVLGLLR